MWMSVFGCWFIPRFFVPTHLKPCVQAKAALRMDAPVVLQFEAASAGRQLFCDGFVRFRQEVPLPHTGTVPGYTVS